MLDDSKNNTVNLRITEDSSNDLKLNLNLFIRFILKTIGNLLNFCDPLELQ